MPVIFTNPGVIDIEAAMTLGVNAKVGTHPIGQFGTGLKYAIAVLLRTGHSVTLYAGLERFSFSTLRKETRGTEYDLVQMNGKSLGFTTALGKKWAVWQAFRELYSNAKDEGGETWLEANGNADSLAQRLLLWSGRRWRKFTKTSTITSFAATGRNSTTDPASSVEIYRGSGIFYKGIRVDSRPTAFAYNFLSHVQLTEDRTIGNSWLVEYYLAEAVRRAPKADFLQEILSKPDIAEHRFNWDGISSKEVAALLRKASSAGNLPPAFRTLANMATLEEGEYETREATSGEAEMLEVAKGQIFALLGTSVAAPILISDKLPTGFLGCAKGEKIFIAGITFTQGQTRLTGTLLEEHLHAAHGFTDMTRRFQEPPYRLVGGSSGEAGPAGGREAVGGPVPPKGHQTVGQAPMPPTGAERY